MAEWLSDCRPDYAADPDPMAKYIIMVRGPEDPERTPRHLRNPESPNWYRHLKSTPIKVWRERLLRQLADGEARTFNRLGVELIDKTADTLHGSVVEEALWSLCLDGLVEFTPRSPVYFRLRRDHG